MGMVAGLTKPEEPIALTTEGRSQLVQTLIGVQLGVLEVRNNWGAVEDHPVLGTKL